MAGGPVLSWYGRNIVHQVKAVGGWGKDEGGIETWWEKQDMGKFMSMGRSFIEGGKEQLYGKKNGQLGPCGVMSLVGVRTSRVLHLHTWEQQGPEEGNS